MAKGQDLSRYQQGAVKRYYEHRDTLAIANLEQLVSDLFVCDDPKQAARLWDRVAKALKHSGADVQAAEKLLVDRDVTALTRLVNQLVAGGKRPTGPPTHATGSAPPRVAAPAAAASPQAPMDPNDPAVLKRAMKAFRKRLKLTRLDEESRLGVGPLSGGKRSAVVAIVPPNQYPQAVWEQLVDQGKLKRAGKGFYALARE